MLTTLTLSLSSYSAEYVDIGYRDGLAIEATVNIDSFVYVVSDYSQDSYSYGLGLGCQGNTYSGVIAVSQIVYDVTQYKTEFQGQYIDANFIAFLHIGLYTERTDLAYKVGAAWPLNEKTSLTTYISNQGMFFGFRRTM